MSPSPSEVDQRIRSLRPPKPYVDPFKPLGSVLEEERRPNGLIERALTVFLAGSECPFTCSFCDLWRMTIDGPTLPGALTQQLQTILRDLETPAPDRLKIYNASNFFDSRAVPPEDLTRIAALSAPFSGVTVESHARTIGPSALAFALAIPGKLEVAIGLETVHPVAAAHLNKRLDLARFDQAARFLTGNGIDLRVFVLLGAPFVPAEESIEWTLHSVKYAAERGAAIVSIIPVRVGNGELERLQALGDFTPPALLQLEEALEACVTLTDVAVTADLWDAHRLPGCDNCRSARIDRMRRMNVSGRLEPRTNCATCGVA